MEREHIDFTAVDNLATRIRGINLPRRTNSLGVRVSELIASSLVTICIKAAWPVNRLVPLRARLLSCASEKWVSAIGSCDRLVCDRLDPRASREFKTSQCALRLRREAIEFKTSQCAPRLRRNGGRGRMNQEKALSSTKFCSRNTGSANDNKSL